MDQWLNEGHDPWIFEAYIALTLGARENSDGTVNPPTVHDFSMEMPYGQFHVAQDRIWWTLTYVASDWLENYVGNVYTESYYMPLFKSLGESFGGTY